MAQQIFSGGGGVVLISMSWAPESPLDIGGLFTDDKRLAAFPTEGKCLQGYLITGMSYDTEDIVIPVAAVDNTRVLYTSGQNFGKFSMEGIVFVGGKSDVLQSLDTTYTTMASASVAPSALTVTGLGMPNTKVFVVAMKFYGADPTIQAVRFSVDCVVAPVTNKR